MEARAADELVPGLLWTARQPYPDAPLVLLGHGRTSDKDHPWLADLAGRFTRRGWNVLAIDAPSHGERRPPGAVDWPRPVAEESTPGWRAALDAVRDGHGVGTDRLLYWGISMGTALGIPLLAHDPRFAAAVLGLMHPDWPAPPGDRLRADAAALTVPVLFLANWDDTRAPRRAAFELFDLIGSTDKRLVAYPGEHGDLPTEALDLSESFLSRFVR